ncbi:prefoldin subunit beta [Candidatus Bathyarchaeota archaeon]|nr:prefoldin subunit beta [Candidatus Bathyarchaeota archaeon]
MSSIGQLPPNVQERIQRLQQLQNTMQQLLTQKQRIEMEITESSKALETLAETDDDSRVYKSVGAVLVERPKDAIVKELEERKEFLEMRMKVIQKQEDKTKERLSEIQANLQKDLGMQQG